MIELRTRFKIVNRSSQVFRILDDDISIRIRSPIGPLGEESLKRASIFRENYRATALDEESHEIKRHLIERVKIPCIDPRKKNDGLIWLGNVFRQKQVSDDSLIAVCRIETDPLAPPMWRAVIV